MSWTTASRRPMIRLTRVDLPTFGRPTTATTGVGPPDSSSPSPSSPSSQPANSLSSAQVPSAAVSAAPSSPNPTRILLSSPSLTSVGRSTGRMGANSRCRVRPPARRATPGSGRWPRDRRPAAAGGTSNGSPTSTCTRGRHRRRPPSRAVPRIATGSTVAPARTASQPAPLNTSLTSPAPRVPSGKTPIAPPALSWANASISTVRCGASRSIAYCPTLRSSQPRAPLTASAFTRNDTRRGRVPNSTGPSMKRNGSPPPPADRSAASAQPVECPSGTSHGSARCRSAGPGRRCGA